MMMVMVMMMMMEMVMITEGRQVVAAGPSLLCPGGQLNDISVGPEGANIIIVICTEHVAIIVELSIFLCHIWNTVE